MIAYFVLTYKGMHFSGPLCNLDPEKESDFRKKWKEKLIFLYHVWWVGSGMGVTTKTYISEAIILRLTLSRGENTLKN